jgi:pyroglutamyl-peptidase
VNRPRVLTKESRLFGRSASSPKTDPRRRPVKEGETANKVLLIGFEPFAGYPSNPSQDLVLEAARQGQKGWQIDAAILPVRWREIPAALCRALIESEAQWVLAFGLAANRQAISLERVAINLLDFSLPDNTGEEIREQAILPGGATAYFSGLPLGKLNSALTAAGIHTEISCSAGTFCCNQAFYLLAHESDDWQRYRGGFIHLPCTPELAAQIGKTTSLPWETMRQALTVILATLEEPLDPV